MILHIPHSSDVIPAQFRDQFLLSDEDLAAELLRMTDAYTDELFAYPGADAVRFPISQLLVDVERFPDDTMEPMAKLGMGRIYTRTAGGRTLRRALQPQETESLLGYYEKHHEALTNAVRTELKTHGKALVIDCHSFPSHPLACDLDQTAPRPDFCMGTDPEHTPPGLIEMTRYRLEEMGYRVEMNRPYAGTLVPREFYEKDTRLMSIMIEVNRSLYMDEETGAKKNSFGSIKMDLQRLLRSLNEFQQDVLAAPHSIVPDRDQ